jgi:Sulfotransferase domain
MPAMCGRKIFCIGSGKTGTTSTGAALSLLGYKVGDQGEAELLIEHWARRNFGPIIEYCHTADAFQDIPYCLDYTYVALDQAFSGSKFILTVRKNSSEWYESMVRFHTKIVGKNRLPTSDDLKEFPYRYPGWIWRAHTLIYGCDEYSLFDRDLYIQQYRLHAAAVLDYFLHRPGDLLILNVSRPNAMDRLCRFLGKQRDGLEMPHLNSSREAA